VAEKLVAANVKATWFVTHRSPAVERLRQCPRLFELGLHPNFLPGSSHGDQPREVLNYCLQIVEDATSMRAHALMQSSPLLDEVCRHTAINVDVSLFLPRACNLQAVTHWAAERPLIRLPYFWEDDFEMITPEPCWDVVSLTNKPGLKIFDFHPIHVFLNSSDSEPYEELKRRTGGDIQQATVKDVDDIICHGPGTASAFDSLLDALSGKGVFIRDLARTNGDPLASEGNGLK